MHKEGKLNNQILKKMLDHLPRFRDDIILRPSVGEDCAAFKANKELAVVITTDPITAADQNHGELAVRVCLNDLASAGVEASSLLLTILAPMDASDEEIETVFKEAGATAKISGVEIIGGHTERTSSVNKMILSATAIGVIPVNKMVKTAGASIGDYIYFTKIAAIEGSMILAQKYGDFDIAEKFRAMLSARKDGIIAREAGVTAMHDVTEGGVLGAVYELCEASSIGCIIDISDIPIDDYTQKICAKLEIDPLRLIGSGSMLIAVSPANATKLEEVFRAERINIKKIGECTATGMVRVDGGRKTKIEPPSEDHIFIQ